MRLVGDGHEWRLLIDYVTSDARGNCLEHSTLKWGVVGVDGGLLGRYKLGEHFAL